MGAQLESVDQIEGADDRRSVRDHAFRRRGPAARVEVVQERHVVLGEGHESRRRLVVLEAVLKHLRHGISRHEEVIRADQTLEGVGGAEEAAEVGREDLVRGPEVEVDALSAHSS